MAPRPEPVFSRSDIQWYERRAEAARAELESARAALKTSAPEQRPYRLDEIELITLALEWYQSMVARLTAYMDGQSVRFTEADLHWQVDYVRRLEFTIEGMRLAVTGLRRAEAEEGPVEGPQAELRETWKRWASGLEPAEAEYQWHLTMVERLAAFLPPEARRRLTPPFLGSAEPHPEPKPESAPAA